MMKTLLSPKTILITVIILTASLSRLLPHPFNFAPIGAMALFGGAYFSNRLLAFVIPMLSLLIGDILMGIKDPLYADYMFDGGFLMIYFCFALVTMLGTLLRNNKPVFRIYLFSIVSSLIFFIVSNFFSWLGIGMSLYPLTFEGLVSCYVNAVPFFKTTLLGDLFYNTIFFGVFYLIGLRFPKLARA
jgi:hypothetical protein